MWTDATLPLAPWCVHSPGELPIHPKAIAIGSRMCTWLKQSHSDFPGHEGIYAHRKGKFFFPGELLRWGSVSLESPGASLPIRWTILPTRWNQQELRVGEMGTEEQRQRDRSNKIVWELGSSQAWALQLSSYANQYIFFLLKSIWGHLQSRVMASVCYHNNALLRGNSNDSLMCIQVRVFLKCL